MEIPEWNSTSHNWFLMKADLRELQQLVPPKVANINSGVVWVMLAEEILLEEINIVKIE